MGEISAKVPADVAAEVERLRATPRPQLNAITTLRDAVRSIAVDSRAVQMLEIYGLDRYDYAACLTRVAAVALLALEEADRG